MINAIGGSSSYFGSLFASGGTSGTSSTGASNSASPLAQTEEKLFAAIDANGDGGISQSEFSSFLNKSAGAAGAGAPTDTASNALFAQMSGGSNSISLQQFQANAGDLVSPLQSEIAAGQPSSASPADSLLSQLAQSAASLAAGSAASIASSASSTATSNTHNTGNGGGHHHHHGGQGGGSLISQFMQQYQAAGATPATATATLSASA